MRIDRGSIPVNFFGTLVSDVLLPLGRDGGVATELSVPFLRRVIMDLREHGNMEQAENLLKDLLLKKSRKRREERLKMRSRGYPFP